MSSTERESVKKGETLIPTPKWLFGIRVAQIIISIIVVGLAGFWIHGAYFDSLGLAIAAGIFTWIVSLYAILTERSAGCRSGYNTWAVLSLDFFLIVLWLASLAYNAQFRSIFVTPVETDCYNDGSAINSNYCDIIGKRAAYSYVADQTGLAILSAIAGLSALLLVFFVITFAYVTHFFRLEWAKHSSTIDAEKASGAVPVAQQQPLQQQQQQQAQPQWANQPAQYQANAYANQPAAPYDPYTAQQNPGYAGAPDAYPQQVPQPAQVQQHQQHQQHQQQQQYYPQQ